MKGKSTVVFVESGNPFPMNIDQDCVRCGKHINSELGDLYTCFANVSTAEEFGGMSALIQWNCVCHDCTKLLSDFFGSNVNYRGNKVYEGVKK